MGSKTPLFVLLLLSSVGMAFAGFWAGSRKALAGPRERIDSFAKSETVGGVAGEKRAEMALAYDDPARAEREMDGYTWAVANMPTPFVGVAPSPGDHDCAHINAQQFRHPTDLVFPKPKDTFRVFVTGGSTAFGTGAPSDDTTITAYLQELVDEEFAGSPKHIEIVNAANPAWASTHERMWIATRLAEMEPDLVVSFSGNNDAHFAFLGLHVFSFRTYAEHFFTLLDSDVLEAVGRDPFPIPWNPSIDGPVPPAEVLRRIEVNLRLTAASLEPTGAPYLFVLQPTLATTKKELTTREAAHLASESLGEGCTDYFRRVYELYQTNLPHLDAPGFHFADASDAFDSATADEEIFLDSYHFGDRGNRVLAARLLEILRPHLPR
ncbi:MAG TPA: SGNH/GDSL hydrolase family protein [Planctomycetes bacterium]|nr:SGNH/GDSL hydrolase family protein [Planctomycetota bacterium]